MVIRYSWDGTQKRISDYIILVRLWEERLFDVKMIPSFDMEGDYKLLGTKIEKP